MNNYAHIINYIMQVISRYLICDVIAASAFGLLAMTVITIVIASKCTPWATATERERNRLQM
jgi:hypothetical protein